MHLLTCTRKLFSIEELGRQSGHKRYRPIWEIINEPGYVMAESIFVENPKKGCKPKRVSPIKMIVINNLKSNTITDIVKEQVDTSAELITDDSTSYSKLKKYVKSHKAAVVKSDLIPTILPWVHIAISKA